MGIDAYKLVRVVIKICGDSPLIVLISLQSTKQSHQLREKMGEIVLDV